MDFKLVGAGCLLVFTGLVVLGHELTRPVALGPAARGSELSRGEVESEIVFRELDRLEARLLSGRERVGLWSELSERHRRVSAIACANLAEQAAITARLHGGRSRQVTKSLRLASGLASPRGASGE